MTTTLKRPRFGRQIIAPLYRGTEATLVHIESEVGREHCYDVRLGVNLDPNCAGYACSAEDDPVVLVVVHATVPAEEWEHTARLLGLLHQRHATPSGLSSDGATLWQTDLDMSQMPWRRS
ncbi:hypothetical protein [Streptacidiphilus albus]|uniref:hypothetical protein n=1 Tax=Streptacidiphilus albus TaxID=105425 RepID=UPI0005AA61C0|nr:hypothetical protein [Streptacidiphilus albus]